MKESNELHPARRLNELVMISIYIPNCQLHRVCCRLCEATVHHIHVIHRFTRRAVLNGSHYIRGTNFSREPMLSIAIYHYRKMIRIHECYMNLTHSSFFYIDKAPLHSPPDIPCLLTKLGDSWIFFWKHVNTNLNISSRIYNVYKERKYISTYRKQR